MITNIKRGLILFSLLFLIGCGSKNVTVQELNHSGITVQEWDNVTGISYFYNNGRVEFITSDGDKIILRAHYKIIIKNK